MKEKKKIKPVSAEHIRRFQHDLTQQNNKRSLCFTEKLFLFLY